MLKSLETVIKTVLETGLETVASGKYWIFSTLNILLCTNLSIVQIIRQLQGVSKVMTGSK